MRPTGTKKDGIKYLLKPECEAFMKATRKNKRDSFLFSLIVVCRCEGKRDGAVEVE